MNSSRTLCVVATISAALIGNELANATEFAVLRQRFDHNGVVLSPSSDTKTPVERIDVSLNTAAAGTLQSVSSSITIVNPDSTGLGDSSIFDVYYTGSPADFPASSFFDVLFVDISNPAGKVINKGSVQGGIIVNQAGRVDASTQFFGDPELLNSLIITPLQPGLSLSGLDLVPGALSSGSLDRFFDLLPQLQFTGQGQIDPTQPLFEVTMTGNSVPEPSTWVLAAMGAAGLMAVARKNWANYFGNR